MKEKWRPYSSAKRVRDIQGDEISSNDKHIEEISNATLPPDDSDNNNNIQSSLEWEDEFKEVKRKSKKIKSHISLHKANRVKATKKNDESAKSERTEDIRKKLDEVFRKKHEKNYNHARRDASFDDLSRVAKHKLVEDGIDDIEDLGGPSSNKVRTGPKRPGIGKKGGGKGLANMNILQLGNGRSCPNMYKYWNNVNELVARLRLLVSSRSSGHTSHDNEILSIIEELREADIIT